MNKVFDPVAKAIVERHVDESSTFWDINEALYHHEQPFYRYCASGGGSNPDERADWRAERDRLYSLWVEKSPYAPAVDPCAIKGTGLMLRCIAAFKSFGAKKELTQD